MAAQTFNVRIWTPQQTLFEGKALVVSSRNSEGKFDILPFHANFITIIKNQPVEVIREDKAVLKFQFTEAIIFIANNLLTIYAEPKSAT